MKEPPMTDTRAGARTRASHIIKARPEEVYAAFMDPDVLVAWLPPARMTGKIHAFDARVGCCLAQRPRAFRRDDDRGHVRRGARRNGGRLLMRGSAAGLAPAGQRG